MLQSCSAQFSKTLSNRSSVEGIWLLSIITYKYTADTCFTLLRCQRVSGGESGASFVRIYRRNSNCSYRNDTTVTLQVYFYNGSIECFHSVHLGASVVALFLSVTVVFLFPVIILIISFKVFKVGLLINSTDIDTNCVAHASSSLNHSQMCLPMASRCPVDGGMDLIYFVVSCSLL